MILRYKNYLTKPYEKLVINLFENNLEDNKHE